MHWININICEGNKVNNTIISVMKVSSEIFAGAFSVSVELWNFDLWCPRRETILNAVQKVNSLQIDNINHIASLKGLFLLDRWYSWIPGYLNASAATSLTSFISLRIYLFSIKLHIVTISRSIVIDMSCRLNWNFNDRTNERTIDRYISSRPAEWNCIYVKQYSLNFF